jgi:hypothetical protein
MPRLHNELLDQFPALLARAIESYWTGLLTNDALCQNLAAASVMIFRERFAPIVTTVDFIAKPVSPIGDMFARMIWHIRPAA